MLPGGIHTIQKGDEAIDVLSVDSAVLHDAKEGVDGSGEDLVDALRRGGRRVAHRS